MPRTSESRAVYWTTYSEPGSKPFFPQIFAGSGVPGKGFAEQSAKAHSEAGILVGAVLAEVRRANVALAVSRVTGTWYVRPTYCVVRRSNVFVPGLMSIRRSITAPVIDEPSGFLAMGTVSVWALSRGRRSPCQPLMTVTCPSSEALAVPLPRFGTR